MKTVYTIPIYHNNHMIIEQHKDSVVIIILTFIAGTNKLVEKQRVEIHKDYYEMFMNYLDTLNFTIHERKSIMWETTFFHVKNGELYVGLFMEFSSSHYTISFYNHEQEDTESFMIGIDSFNVIQKILKNICQQK